MSGTERVADGSEPVAGEPTWRVYPDQVEPESVPLESGAGLTAWTPGLVEPAPDQLTDGLYQAWRKAVSAGSSEDNPMVFQAGSDTVKRSGRWNVPPYLRLHSGSGSIKLDFRQAVPLSPVIVVEVKTGMGTIKLLLPRGWAARSDVLSRSWGTCRIEVEDTPEAGSPLLIVRGKVSLGTFVMRYPTAREDRKLAKRMAREAESLR
ncbi:MAG: cell wall-active antibiotics response protein [Propionibacteriaceae bacterium]|jgi:hypothetical protein|nr:cell wall-active antibiotics response protein [Propionibacteriaceae bacterium]